MHKNWHLHWHFYSRVVIGLAILVLGSFFLYRSVDTKAVLVTEDGKPVRGFAWSDVIGWISLNCRNDFYGNGLESMCDKPYGLTITQSGGINYITGCGWAGQSANNSADYAVGYVCFSKPPLPSTNTSTPAGGIRVINNTNDANYLNTSVTEAPSIEKFIGKDNKILASQADKINQNNINEPDRVDADNPIRGCFNCYEEDIKRCRLNSGISCTSDAVCKASNPADVCDITGREYKCENCLDYDYYTAADHALRSDGYRYSRPVTVSGGANKDVRITLADKNFRSVIYPLGHINNTNYYDVKFTTSDVDGATKINHKIESYSSLNGVLTVLLRMPPASETIYMVYGKEVTTTEEDGTFSEVTNLSATLGSEKVYYIANDIKLVRGGYGCSECTVSDYELPCELSAYEANSNSCNSCTSVFRQPGIMVDTAYNTTNNERDAYLCGWGYNEEIGWIQFSGRPTTSTRPYILAEGGDVFSKKDIIAKYAPPPGRYNASYLIESGGTIKNFFSGSTLSSVFQGELSGRSNPLNFLNFESNTGKNTNALASIDTFGLVTPVKPGATPKINKYGSIIKFYPDDFAPGETMPNTISTEQALENKVYYVENDLIIESGDPTLYIGNENNKDSAGLILVNGGLYIGSNIEYQNNLLTIDNLKEIPSLVWVVLGDVIVHPDVTKVAGTFVILGDLSLADCSSNTANCGQFISCDTTPAVLQASVKKDCSNQLTVTGNVIARRFLLERTFYNTAHEPAEIFINDGRIQANPPLGLLDFAQVIPRFNSRP